MPEDMIAGHFTPWRVWEKGGDRPVLALHCSLAHSGAWAGVAAGLSGVTLTALDQPGHGKAADWDGVTDIHDLTTRIAVQMAEMLGNGGPIDLFGHSFGGTVCLRLAIERPDLVRSLTLVEPVIFAAARGTAVYNDFRAAHMQVAHVLQSESREQAAALFHAAWGTGDRLDDLPDRQRQYIIDRIHLIVAQNPALLDDSANIIVPGGLEAVQVPVLLVEGADSPPIIDAVHSALSARLPHVTRRSVSGAGHMVSITHAAIVAEAVQAHLDCC